jgi:acetyl-CoA acetyltransferase
MTSVNAMESLGAKRAVATMCVGVGQGIALMIEKV